MSALPPKADIVQRSRDVRFVPVPDIPEEQEARVTPEAAEIAALLGFGPVRTRPSRTALELCYGDDQPPLRYSGPVQNRRRFPRAGDTNGRWDRLQIVEKAVSSNRTIDCDRTVRPDRRRQAAVSSRAGCRTAVLGHRL